MNRGHGLGRECGKQRALAHLNGDFPSLWPPVVVWECGLRCSELPVFQEKFEI